MLQTWNRPAFFETTFSDTKTCWPSPKIWHYNKCVKITFLGIEILNKICFIGFFVTSIFLVGHRCFDIWNGCFKKRWSILCLEHFIIVLSMLEKQIWNHKFPQFWFTNFGQYSGLFGLYGLEGQTKGIGQILNTSWLQLGEKIMKIQLFPHLAFGATFKNFFGLFAFFEILDA